MSTLTAKGQVTIPKPIRDRLGLRPGNRVFFLEQADGRITIVNGGTDDVEARIQALRGHAGPGMTTDEVMAITRGED